MALPHPGKTLQLPDSSAPCPLAPLRVCPRTSPVTARFSPLCPGNAAAGLTRPVPKASMQANQIAAPPPNAPAP
ncbi:hypothetical protein M2324_000681 [Rhodovulum sulfidophilum]|nr:hypothetical protein [Rhodovulum sulfidophilum]